MTAVPAPSTLPADRPRLAVAPDALFVSRPPAHRLYQYDHRGRLQQCIGTGRAGLRDGAAAAAQFNRPCGLAADAHALNVADSGNDAIRRVDRVRDQVTTVARRCPTPDTDCYTCDALQRPVAIVAYGDNFFIAARAARQLLVLHPLGVGPAAGSGRAGMADGEMPFASFRDPQALAVGQWGHSVYVLDAGQLRTLDYHLRLVRTAAPLPDRPEPGWQAIAADPQQLYLAHPEAPLVSILDSHRYRRQDRWAVPLTVPVSDLVQAGGVLWALGADGLAVARYVLARGESAVITLEQSW